MKCYVLYPEVAGAIGPKTIYIDRTARPPRMEKFNYEFNGWLGDPLLVSICSYIVTDSLKREILASSATGVTFGPVEITKSSEFDDARALKSGRKLPRFVWLQPIGSPGQDDFGLTSTGGYLVVSEPMLDLFLAAGMSNCDIADFEKWKGAKKAKFRREK
jgi:hypothetical protein